MAWPPLSPARRHTHPLQKLSPEKFENLIYRLVQRSGAFEDIHWYRGARDDSRDIVMLKYVGGEWERWYVHCRMHQYVDYAILQDELKHLARHAERILTFTPHVIVYTAACDIPPNDKNKTTIYARALGLPAPRFWDAPVLLEMLAEQPATKQEFLGQLEATGPADERRPLQQVSAFLRHVNGQDVVIAGAGLLIAAGLFCGWRALQGQGAATVTSPRIAQPTSSPGASLSPSPASTPTPSFAFTPTPTFSPTPSPSNTPTSTPRPTNTPRPTPEPTVTPSPTLAPTPAPPILLTPKSGELLRYPVFRWQGYLGYGQSYILHLEHLASGWTWQSGSLKATCQQIDLPYELFGGWRWWVNVVAADTILVQSEARDIWFDPYLSDLHPTPAPCGK